MSNPLVDLAAEFHEFAGEVNEHLTQATGDLRQHAEWISETAPLIDGHTAALQEHADRLTADTRVLADLRTDVNELLAELPRQPRFPPVNWLTLPAEDADKLWIALGEWVDAKLVQRHFVSRGELPDCWPLHTTAVEHVTWLHTAWQHAMLPTAGANASTEWHSRWFAEALRLIPADIKREAEATGNNRCMLGEHFGAALDGAGSAQQPVPAHLHQAQPPHAQPPTPYAAGVPRHGGWTADGQPVAAAPNWRNDTTTQQPWDQAVPTPTPRDPFTDKKAELAMRRYWWPQLEAARAVDVAQRREAERQAAEATAREAAPE